MRDFVALPSIHSPSNARDSQSQRERFTPAYAPPMRTRALTFTDINNDECKSQDAPSSLSSCLSSSRLSTGTILDNQRSSSPLPSLTIDSNNQHAEILVIKTPRSPSDADNDAVGNNELSVMELRSRLLADADSVLEDTVDDPTVKRRARGLLLSKLKSADRERAAMTRDLYEEVLMALQVQQEEEEQRRKEDRAERDREEEKKRRRAEHYKQKEEERAIKFTHPAAMIKILTNINTGASTSSSSESLSLPRLSSPSRDTGKPQSSFESFIATDVYQARYFGFDSDCEPAPSANNVRTIEWLHPPHLPYNLHHALRPSDFPCYIHSDVDIIDPSGQAIQSLLTAWLAQYRSELTAFTSPIIYIETKLTELRHITQHLAQPNSIFVFVSIDSILRLINLSVTNKSKIILSVLLDSLVTSIYSNGITEIDSETWAVRARTNRLALTASQAERSALMERVRFLHNQWLKVLSMWQPCIARAIVKWQNPIKSLVWHHWRAINDRQRYRHSRYLTGFAKLRKRHEMKRYLLRTFIAWRHHTNNHRLVQLNDELLSLDRINGNKFADYRKLFEIKQRHENEIEKSLTLLEEAELRIQMLEIQSNEYRELLTIYGSQSQATQSLIESFCAMTIRAAEQSEISLVQLFYSHYQNVELLKDLPNTDKSIASRASISEALIISGAVTDSPAIIADDLKKRSRSSMLVNYAAKKKLSSNQLRKHKEQETIFSRTFLKSWARLQIQQLSDTFSGNKELLKSVVGEDECELVLTTETGSSISDVSLTEPVSIVKGVMQNEASQSQTEAQRTLYTMAINCLYQLNHPVFPFAPFSHPSSFLYHHSHSSVVEFSVTSPRVVSKKVRKHGNEIDGETGVTQSMLSLLSLSLSDPTSMLPSVFTFIPDFEFLLSQPSQWDSPYALHFAQSSIITMKYFVFHTVEMLPMIAENNLTSSGGGKDKVDSDIVAAACLWLATTYPALPNDFDDQFLKLQELLSLIKGYCFQPQTLLSTHSDVMRAMIAGIRAWRKSMGSKRKSLVTNHFHYMQHLHHAAEEITVRLIKRIREKESVVRSDVSAQLASMKDRENSSAAANLTYANVVSSDADVPLFRPETAFGEVETEFAPTEIDLNNNQQLAKRKKKERKARAKQEDDDGDAGADGNDGAGTHTNAVSHDIGNHGSSTDRSAEYEAEKALDDAENSSLTFDIETFHTTASQLKDKIRKKMEEESKKAAKKKKKDGNTTQAGEDGDKPADPAATGTEGENEGDDEDAAVKCETVLNRYIIELRRLFRNSCSSDDKSDTADTDTVASAVTVTMLATSQPGLMLTSVQFGRLARKYKILSKTCSAQFIDSLWQEIVGRHSHSSAGLLHNGVGSDESSQMCNFDEFLELLLRVSASKYSEGQIDQRFGQLLSKELFPDRKGSSEMADFRTVLSLTCEPIFEKYNKFLSQIFRAYATDRESAGGVNEPAMTRTNFDEFMEHTGLLQKKLIAVRTVATLWQSAQMDEADDDLFGGDSSMVFWEFLESVAALACHYHRDPFLPVDTRLDLFISYLMEQCPQVETKRRMYAAKTGVGGKKEANETLTGTPARSRPASPRQSRPTTASQRAKQ